MFFLLFFYALHTWREGGVIAAAARGRLKNPPFPSLSPLVFTLDSIAGGGGGGGGGKKILGKMKRELIWEIRFIPVYIRPILAHI